MSKHTFNSTKKATLKYTAYVNQQNLFRYGKGSFNNLCLNRTNKLNQKRIYGIISTYLRLSYRCKTNIDEYFTIVQDTVVTILSYDDGKKITKPLVDSIARNIFLKIVSRNNAKKRKSNNLYDAFNSGEHNDRPIEFNEIHEAIESNLNYPHKEVLQYTLQNFTQKQISNKINKSTTTVNRIKKEGILLLKQCMFGS